MSQVLADQDYLEIGCPIFKQIRHNLPCANELIIKEVFGEYENQQGKAH